MGVGTQSNQAPTGQPTTNLSNVADDAQKKLEEKVDQVRQTGMSQLGSQKDRVAQTVGSVASALHQTSQHLREGDEASVAAYVDQIADRVDQFSRDLRERDMNQIVADAEGFARQQPILFIGGAFLLGFAAARFLKSARPEAPRSANYATPYTNGPRGETTALTAPRATTTNPPYTPMTRSV
jgi:hypothetical protein